MGCSQIVGLTRPMEWTRSTASQNTRPNRRGSPKRRTISPAIETLCRSSASELIRPQNAKRQVSLLAVVLASPNSNVSLPTGSQASCIYRCVKCQYVVVTSPISTLIPGISVQTRGQFHCRSPILWSFDKVIDLGDCNVCEGTCSRTDGCGVTAFLGCWQRAFFLKYIFTYPPPPHPPHSQNEFISPISGLWEKPMDRTWRRV